MNLNYEKIKEKVEHGGNHWTSYSDLFLVLSVVFLLLYVVANLRSSTMSFATYKELQSAKAEVEEMRKQVKAYEVLKDDYLQRGASQDEVQQYQDLMGKLSLLEDEAKAKQEALSKASKEAGDKRQALNQYQAMVKNIISANLVAQAKLKKRDQTIDEKQQVIGQRETELDTLQQSVQAKESEIDRNNQTISQIQDKLKKQVQEVQYAYRSKQRSQEKMKQEIAKLQTASEQRIASLRTENNQFAGQLEQAKSQIAAKTQESKRLLDTLQGKEKQYKATIAELDRNFQSEREKEREAFEANLKTLKIGAEARIRQEQAHRAAVEKRQAEYAARMGSLNSQLAQTQQNIQGIEGKYQQAIKGIEGEYQGLQAKNETLSRNLEAAIHKQNEQKILAEKIKQNFRKAGINADIDPKTGDVTVNFGHEYFDRASANLKNGMRQILERLVPVYAGSLFTDPKVAKRITGVEIVGFASPTYQGKYVNPESLEASDRQAVNYNMDLSYQRAKSIFEHVFDPKKMTFRHQKDLLPLVKVSGRSYLATEKVAGRAPAAANLTDGQYCQVYDCSKSQKVIIKFNLKEE